MIEYEEIVVVGQTHSRKTHNRFYVKTQQLKKQRYEEATRIQETFERIVPPPPPEETHPDIYEEMRAMMNALPSNPIVIPPDEDDQSDSNQGFGTARSDILKKGKRFEWTTQEIQHLQHYIIHIEPFLTETEKSNKYASCLSYLRSADPEIKKYFHPHHVVNSGRIKTGYDSAVAKFRDVN